MSAPELSIERSWGWTIARWEVWQPVLERSLTHAQRGLRNLEIAYRQPKTVKVRRFASETALSANRHYGWATSAERFGLHVVIDDDPIPRRAKKAALWSCTVVHELVHCARMEQVEYKGLAERIASEGLAYAAEELYRQRFCAKQVASRFVASDFEVNPALAARFSDLMGDDTSEQPILDRYFDEESACQDMPDGALYGMQQVHRRLGAGRRLADLLHQPATALLGL